MNLCLEVALYHFSISKAETKTQEIILLLTLIVSPSFTLAGVFYLFSQSEILGNITGRFGVSFLVALFNILGYVVFFVGISLMFLGRYVLARVTEPKDIFQHMTGFAVHVAINL